MHAFLKIVDLNGDILYVNPSWVVTVRPGNRTSFKASGAEIKVADGTDVKSFFTEPGEATDTVVKWMGVENY